MAAISSLIICRQSGLLRLLLTAIILVRHCTDDNAVLSFTSKQVLRVETQAVLGRPTIDSSQPRCSTDRSVIHTERQIFYTGPQILWSCNSRNNNYYNDITDRTAVLQVQYSVLLTAA